MRKLTILAMLLMLCGLAACAQKNTARPAPLPDMSIAVAWFNQPFKVDDLLAGIMTSDQSPVGEKVLMNLDHAMDSVLRNDSKRVYIFIPGAYKLQVQASRVAKTGTALEYWAAVGKSLNADMILVPQVTGWQEREGGSCGVEKPAAVTMDFYLIDVKNAALVNRYHFEETQETLTSNLLTFGKFVERKGRWVTALDLATEGMHQAVRELGL